ncbi:MAG: universal stress protein [bacterium]
MERKIIVGYDPAHGGPDVLRLGRVLAEVVAAKPIIVTALPWPNYLMGVKGLQKQVDAEMQDRFAVLHEQFADLDGETRAIASPSVAEALHELAEGEGAEAIVLGSSHRGRIGRTLAGSVGESLMHGAPCAVAVAPRGYAERDLIRLVHIAVAFDGSPEAWAALETAIGTAERCRGRISVICVAEDPRYGYSTMWSILVSGEFADHERPEKQRLLELATGRIPAGLEGDGRLLTGDAGTLLAEVSGEFDLMVAGSRAYGPLRRTLLGSTTRRLISSCACPVLVLPRAAGIDPLGLRDPAAAAGSRLGDRGP